MKIRKKSVWKDKKGVEVRVSRLRKDEICFHSKDGGGAEQRLARGAFLAQYEPA